MGSGKQYHFLVSSLSTKEKWRSEICALQLEGVHFPNTTIDRLVIDMDPSSGLLMCGGRIQNFREDYKGVPLLPFHAWISTLLAREAHSERHDGVAGTLLRMRKKALITKGRIIARKVVDKCVVCRKTKARTCQQIMGGLPKERSSPAAPFQFTSVDLFGPYHVKDDVKRRRSTKVWGVLFCCMASQAIHVELASALTTESFLLAYQRTRRSGLTQVQISSAQNLSWMRCTLT